MLLIISTDWICSCKIFRPKQATYCTSEPLPKNPKKQLKSEHKNIVNRQIKRSNLHISCPQSIHETLYVYYTRSKLCQTAASHF